MLLQFYSEVSLSEKRINDLIIDISYVMFLNPSLTFYLKMFISTKAGIGALSLKFSFFMTNNTMFTIKHKETIMLWGFQLAHI